MAAKPNKKSKKSKIKSPTKEAVEKMAKVAAQEEEEAEVVLAAVKESSSKKKKNKKDKKDTTTTTTTTTTNTDLVEEKKTKKKSSKKSKKAPEPEPEESSEDENDDMINDTKLTLEALDAISDEEDDDDDDAAAAAAGGDDGEEWGAEAEALRKKIMGGEFDGLLKKYSKKDKSKGGKVVAEKEGVEDEEEEEEEMEEVVMEEEDEDEEVAMEENEDEEEEEEEDDEEAEEIKYKAIALSSAVQSANRHLPWEERFDIIPPTPLPFGLAESSTTTTAAAGSNKKRKRELNDEDDEEEEIMNDEVVDIHDDLKREVAFHDCALEAVHLAREKCVKAGIPFTRPEDFFAEMVKTDEHMAKIKDRLIFETKKIDAVERRKSNKEQTVMAKERHAHRLAEKSKSKKAHMSAVEDWRKSAETGRRHLGGKVVDNEEEEERLRGLGGGNKRMAANRKFGFGGKTGRFKQNDKKSMDDGSKFNPRGNFGGIGKKTTTPKKGGGGSGGNKRHGKRARDAARSK